MQAAARGEMSVVLTRTPSAFVVTTSTSLPVSKNGNASTTERSQAARWVQHFQEVLNSPEPDGPASPPSADDVLEINTSPPTEVEVRTAIKATKSGKAPSIDSIHAEMLKADIETSTKILTDLFTIIWTKNTIPADWTKALLSNYQRKEMSKTPTTGEG